MLEIMEALLSNRQAQLDVVPDVVVSCECICEVLRILWVRLQHAKIGGFEAGVKEYNSTQC